MDHASLTEFFMWCAFLAGGLYLLSAVMCACCGDWIYRVQSRFFPMPRETFTVVLYGYLGFFKIIFLVFVLVPYLALLCMR